MNIAPAELLNLICARIVGPDGSVASRNYAIRALTAVIGDGVNEAGRGLSGGEVDRAIAEVLKMRERVAPAPAELAVLFGAPEEEARDINTAESALRELGRYAL